jgi:hypothetical protein
MASYRLIDEVPDARQSRPPYSPLGLFFLTMFFFPFTAPLWVVNWGRLRRPEKRLITAIASVIAFVIPIALLTALGANRETSRIVGTLCKFIYAYTLLYGQRPLYEAHVNRGGKSASSWPLWITGLISVVLYIVFVIAMNQW